jgi:WD40 repeat protein
MSDEHDEDEVYLDEADTIEEFFVEKTEGGEGDGDNDSDSDGEGDGDVPTLAAMDEDDADMGAPALAEIPLDAIDPVQTIGEHTGPVYCVTWAGGEGTFASGSGDETVVLSSAADGGVRSFGKRVDAWEETAPDTDEGEKQAPPAGAHGDSVVRVKLNATQSLCASAGLDGIVNVWQNDSSPTGFVCALDGPGGPIEWIDWHPKGNVVAAGSDDGTAWIWSVSSSGSSVFMRVFGGHAGSCSAGCFSPDGKKLATGDSEGCMRLFAPKTGECELSLPLHHDSITDIKFAHDTLTASSSLDSSIRFTNLQNGKILGSTLRHEEPVESIDFSKVSPAGLRLASGSLDTTARIWDVGTYMQLFSMKHEGAVPKVMWLPTEPLLFTASVDGLARIFDSRSGALVHSLAGHSGPIFDLAISPDAVFLATASDDGLVNIYDRRMFGQEQQQ